MQSHNTPLFSLFTGDNGRCTGVRTPQGSKALHQGQANVAMEESLCAELLSIKSTWMSTFKLICMRCQRKLLYLSYILYFDHLFHRCTNKPDLQIKAGEMQDSQGCCRCVLPAPLRAVWQTSTVHGHHQSSGKLW